MASEPTQPCALALVGMPGARKTLCAMHLQERGFFQFRFGSIVVDEVARRGLPLNPNNERIIREEFRAQDGMDAIAKRALPLLKQALGTHKSIIIDGLYSFAEYKTLKKELGEDMIVVAITAPRNQRYARLAERRERPLTRAEAQERDFREIEKIEKGGPIALADYTLLNDSTPEDLLQKLDDLLAELQMEP